MSYCRFVEADIYLYHDCDGTIHCCACRFEPLHRGNKELGMGDENFHGTATFKTRTEAKDHVFKHLAAGHNVPLHVLDRLEMEIRDIGDSVKTENSS